MVGVLKGDRVYAPGTVVRRFKRRLRGLLHPRRQRRRAPIGGLGAYILGFCSQTTDRKEYAEWHLGRMVRTLEITPRGAPSDRILEMGAYMQMTPALRTKLGYGEVRGCYLGPLGKTDEKSVTSDAGETFRCLIDLFNAESDRYPYPDGHFRTVVCCELLEHLSEDPMHLMAEVNRILPLGGHLVLSTPNACAIRAVSALLGGNHPALNSQYTKLKGGNTVEPRHAREYTPREIAELFRTAGFKIEHLDTGPFQLVRSSEHDWLMELLKPEGLAAELGDDVIHAVGRKTGPVKDRYPEWLYTR